METTSEGVQIFAGPSLCIPNSAESLLCEENYSVRFPDWLVNEGRGDLELTL